MAYNIPWEVKGKEDGDMSNGTALRGMMTIIRTPFNDAGEIDETSYRRELEHVVQSGITGVIAGANASQGFQLLDHALFRLWEITLDQINGRIPVGFGTLRDSANATLYLVKKAQEMGADFTMTPGAGRSHGVGSAPRIAPTPDGMYDWYRHILDHTDIPMMLYDSLNHYPIPQPVVLKLADEYGSRLSYKAEIAPDSVFYIMETGVGDKITILSGQEQYLMPHLQDGAVGGTHSVSMVAPELNQRVFDAAEAKDWPRAWMAFRDLWPVILALYNKKYRGLAFPQTFYWMGIFDSVNLESPTKPLSPELQAQLRKTMVDAGIRLVR
jgi:dihydrodipicolinate synthase/N-acetylneuraminate lyase